MVLVLLAVLPALGIILYSAAHQRDHTLTMAREKALVLAREVSRLQNDHLARAQDMAFTLGQTSQVQGLQAAACAELFAAILRKTPQLANLSACTHGGQVFASGHPMAQEVSFCDRPWFQQTVREGRPVVSGYVIGRITNKPVIAVTQPVKDESGALLAVLVASSDLQWLNRSLDATGLLPGGAYVTIIDTDGVVLMRHPHQEGLLGQALPNTPVAQVVLGRREGVVQALGTDGDQWVYGFAPLHPGRDFAYAIVGIPEDEAFAETKREHVQYLLLFGLALALALAATWQVGGRLLARPVDSLLQVTKRLAQGDLAARSGLPRGSDELSQLAAEFDGMAESLAWQYTELQQSLDLLSASNRALRMLGHSNQAMIRADDEARLMEEVCRIVVEEGGHQMAWVGLAMGGEGQPLRPAAQWGDQDGLVEALRLTWAEDRRGRCPADPTILASGPVVFDDLACDPESAPWRAAALERGFASAMALPLRADGEIMGSLNVYAARPEAFPQEEVDLLAEMADDLAFGIKGLRARAELERATEELRRHRDSLEDLVAERTRELRDEVDQRRLAQQGQERFVRLVENSGEFIGLATLDGKMVYLNQAGQEMAGLAGPLQTGEGVIFDFLTEESVALVKDSMLPQVLEQGRWTGEMRLRPLNHGAAREVEASAFALSGLDEAHPLLAVILRDVTQRKQAESERDRFFNLSSDMLAVAGMDGLFKQVNPCWQRTLGWSVQELTSRPWLDFVHPDDQAATIQAGQELLAGREVRGFENRYLTKEGPYRWLSWASFPLIEEGLVFASARDVTEIKQAQEAVARLAAIVWSSTDGIISKDLEGLITSWNQGAERIYGYQAEEVLGRHASLLAPPERTSEIEAILEGIKKGQAVSHFETVRRRKDGSLFDVSLNVSPMYDGQGRVMGASTIARDITERKQAQAELARSNAELEQFAYVASHDLQEPLRIVTNYLQLLERRYKDKLEPEAARFIGQAVNGAARMRGLIQDLLAYSRVGTRGKPLEPVSVESVIEDVLANLKMAIEASQAVVNYDPLPSVRADASQLGQLLQNLIGNALKFRGTESPRVHVSAKREGEEWVFAVRDNGIGIEPQYLERIFGVFQRLHTRSEYPGTGIGLAVCKRIVERHKGRIWVESRPGQGTTFYFSIPAEEGRRA